MLADSALSPAGVLNVESCTVDPADPKELYLTTEYDGLWFTRNAHADRPAFQPVRSYHFRHPLRVQFGPFKPGEMWVTSFGNGMSAGQVRRD